MRNKYIIIDDFYSDPDQIRTIFLDRPKSYEQGNWAGQTSAECLYDQRSADVFAEIVGHRVEPSTTLNGRVRFSQCSDKFTQDIHFDPGFEQVWAGVVYLTPDDIVPDINECGTQFWKHNRTNLEEIPMSPEQGAQYGWYTIDDLRKFLETDGVDRSKWTRTFTIPWRYNRLVLFRPWLFHSPGYPFGNTIETCRVVQTFFLKNAE